MVPANNVVLRIAFAFLSFASILAPHAAAQHPAPAPVGIDDLLPVARQKVELQDGKYKFVYKNKSGQVIKEEVFQVTGMFAIRVEKSVMFEAYPDGTPRAARIVTYGEDPREEKFQAPTQIRDEIYDPMGKVTERDRYTPLAGAKDDLSIDPLCTEI
jgi:hypothetical protein